jgi:ribose/xylose/arabinose/galactoside ABC-type transport system permease subunit
MDKQLETPRDDSAAVDAPGPDPVRRGALAQVLRLPSRAVRARSAFLFATIAVLCVVFQSLDSSFLTLSNVLTIGRNTSEIGIIAIGMTIVLVVGEIDLSVGALYGLGGVVAGLVLADTGNIALAIAAPLIVGLVAGLINGVLVGYARLNSFMVTLATMNVFLGVTLALTGGRYVDLLASSVGGAVAGPILFLGSGDVLGIPSQLFIYGLMTVLGIIVLRLTVLGYHLFAVGSNEAAARVSGINGAKTKVIAFAISGFLAGGVGLLALGFVGSIDPTAGLGIEFDVFAATIIGGASLAGGRGTLLGTMLGAVILAIVDSGLILVGVTSTYQTLFVGLVILGAIGLERVTAPDGQRRRGLRTARA